MPAQINHLAIAKRYLEKHPNAVQDKQAFIDGNILPDLHKDKAISHCGVRTETHDLIKRNREKVSPEKFAATHDMSDSLNQGQYLHLYVDYHYYNSLVLEYCKTATWSQSSIDMYETSRRDDKHLMQKYGVSYRDSSLFTELMKINALWDQERIKYRSDPDYKFELVYSLEELDNFIEKMSDIDIPQG